MAAKKKSIDGAKLIKMVEDKVPRPEIMKKLNIKTSNQLTLAYARAQMEAGKIPRDCRWTWRCSILAMPMRLRLENVEALSFQNRWQKVLESLSVINFPLERPKRG